MRFFSEKSTRISTEKQKIYHQHRNCFIFNEKKFKKKILKPIVNPNKSSIFVSQTKGINLPPKARTTIKNQKL